MRRPILRASIRPRQKRAIVRAKEVRRRRNWRSWMNCGDVDPAVIAEGIGDALEVSKVDCVVRRGVM